MAYDFLVELDNTIAQRIDNADESASYTAQLAKAGVARVAQKVGEEGVELAIAAVTDEDGESLLGEAADLIYHMAVLLQLKGYSLADACVVLNDRHAATKD
ncbi:MAG: phosphoribosyl-ATP diphosphatase [Pseudomonadota bacterium]